MSQVIQFQPRQARRPQPPVHSLPAHQSPVLRFTYTDQIGYEQHASISSSGGLVAFSSDPMAQEIFLQALGAALAVCGARLTSAHTVASACVELDCSNLYCPAAEEPSSSHESANPEPGRQHAA